MAVTLSGWSWSYAAVAAADLVPDADANIITAVTGSGSSCCYAAVAAAMADVEDSASIFRICRNYDNKRALRRMRAQCQHALPDTTRMWTQRSQSFPSRTGGEAFLTVLILFFIFVLLYFVLFPSLFLSASLLPEIVSVHADRLHTLHQSHILHFHLWSVSFSFHHSGSWTGFFLIACAKHKQSCFIQFRSVSLLLYDMHVCFRMIWDSTAYTVSKRQGRCCSFTHCAYSNTRVLLWMKRMKTSSKWRTLII